MDETKANRTTNKELRMNPEIGYRIRVARLSLHKSQKDMAEKLGLGQSTYNLMENGKRSVSMAVLQRYIALGFDAMWILSGKGQPVYTPQLTAYTLIKRIDAAMQNMDRTQLEFLYHTAMFLVGKCQDTASTDGMCDGKNNGKTDGKSDGKGEPV